MSIPIALIMDSNTVAHSLVSSNQHVSFWCLFLPTSLVTWRSKIGVQLQRLNTYSSHSKKQQRIGLKTILQHTHIYYTKGSSAIICHTCIPHVRELCVVSMRFDALMVIVEYSR